MSRVPIQFLSVVTLCSTITLGSSATADEPTGPETSADEADSADEGLSSNDKGAVIGFGVAAVLLGSSYYSFHKSAAPNDDAGFTAYRDSVSGDVCDAASRGFVSDKAGADSPGDVAGKCESSKDWQLAGRILAAGGAVALGVSLAALLWPEEEKAEKGTASTVRLAPVISHTGGAVHIDVTF
jgi:hypothetical protein